MVMMVMVTTWNVEESQGDISSMIRMTFGSFYGWRHITLRSRIIDHLFDGLDEIKYCMKDGSIHFQQHSPYSDTSLSIFEKLFPNSLPKQQEQDIEYENAWTGCIIGSLRSSSAAYLLFTDSLHNVLPMSMFSLLIDSKRKSKRRLLEIFHQLKHTSLSSTLVNKGITYTTKHLLGWK